MQLYWKIIEFTNEIKRGKERSKEIYGMYEMSSLTYQENHNDFF